MITVYIASPYTRGNVEENVRNSLRVADELFANGFAPYAPLLSHFWHRISPKTYEEWMTLDKEWVMRCDCLLRLPGASHGADEEEELAKYLNKPVFYSVRELCEWNTARGEDLFALAEKIREMTALGGPVQCREDSPFQTGLRIGKQIKAKHHK